MLGTGVSYREKGGGKGGSYRRWLPLRGLGMEKGWLVHGCGLSDRDIERDILLTG